MSKKYAVVENNVVTNVILWDGESNFEVAGSLIELELQSTVGVGWHFDGESWTAPEPVSDPNEDSVALLEAEQAVARASGIAKLVALGLTEEEATALVGGGL